MLMEETIPAGAGEGGDLKPCPTLPPRVDPVFE